MLHAESARDIATRTIRENPMPANAPIPAADAEETLTGYLLERPRLMLDVLALLEKYDAAEA